ncbi:flagellar hook-basal body complex protein FliE [bacterium]|nr:flagellar hook-basal body complex protein FliE [bacterium]
MRISPVSLPGSISSIANVTSSKANSSVGGFGNDSFDKALNVSISELDDTQDKNDVSVSELVKKGIKEVNSLQSQADDMAVKLASGDIENVHEAMIAMQKAKLAFEFTVQVRNKIIDAYQEIMRMQV